MPDETFTLTWMEPCTLTTDQVLMRYYHPETLGPLCEACKNYGRNYACPPMTTDAEALMRRYPYLHLTAAKLSISPTFPPEKLERLFVRGMQEYNRVLGDCEAADEGSMAIWPGHCTLCDRCLRADGLPCLHLERLRLSMDALSLEIARIAVELFHFQIQWYRDRPPSYLTMIGGLLSFRSESPRDGRIWPLLEITPPSD